MADNAAIRTAILDVPSAASLPCAAAELRVLPPAARFIFRGGEAARTAAAMAFGIDLPTVACRLAESDGRAALWLGPDEWLLTAPNGDDFGALAGALSGLPHATVDVGHRNVGIEISGPEAATVLAAGCPLDLDPSAFPVGMCTRTVLGKAEIVLWRTAATIFRIEVWRSFAPYVWQFLDEARGEFR
jgi:sarcosine oxidase subunit gamma